MAKDEKKATMSEERASQIGKKVAESVKSILSQYGYKAELSGRHADNFLMIVVKGRPAKTTAAAQKKNAIKFE